MWAAEFVVILLFASLPWDQRGSRHMVRPYAEPSLASPHLSETDIEALDNNSV